MRAFHTRAEEFRSLVRVRVNLQDRICARTDARVREDRSAIDRSDKFVSRNSNESIRKPAISRCRESRRAMFRRARYHFRGEN
jgi:hypothetical protein